MKFLSYITKYRINIWWLIVTTATVFLVYNHNDKLIGQDGSNMKILIALLIILVLYPFFSEIKLLGVSFKKSIKKVENDIKDLKSIVNTNNQSVNLYNGIPGNMERLDELLKSINKEDSPKTNLEDIEYPEDMELFFKIRYKLENEIRRIWNSQHEMKASPFNFQFSKISRRIDYKGRLTDNEIEAIFEIYKICSVLIHGDRIDENQRLFVNETALYLIDKLNNIR